MSLLMKLFGGAVAVAGGDKLIGNQGYRGMFRHLGWSDQAMRTAAAAETLGGMLMVPAGTRRLGGALVAGVSAAVLVSELRRGDGKLALPRAVVLAGGALALLARRR
jgi:hypothetical protein